MPVVAAVLQYGLKPEVVADGILMGRGADDPILMGNGGAIANITLAVLVLLVALPASPAGAQERGQVVVVGVELVTVAEPIMSAALRPRLIELVRNATVPTTWRIVETGGPPEAALLTELARDENQLWCVGSHARGALGDGDFGCGAEYCEG